MRTRSQYRNQNRPQQQAPPVVVEPFNFEEPFDMAANGAGGAGPPPAGGGGLPVPDLQTMEELCQPSLDGRGGPIAPIAIQATTFRLKNYMIQQVQNSCPFCGPSDDANKHLDKFLHVTQSMKVNRVSDDALPADGTFMKRRPEECYDLIESMTAHHNYWDTFAQRNKSLSSNTSSNLEIASLKLQMEEMNRNLTRVLQANQQVNTVTPSCETCGGLHSYNDCPATVGQNQNVRVDANTRLSSSGRVYLPRGILKNCSRFLDLIAIGKSTLLTLTRIVFTSSPALTSLGDSGFFLFLRKPHAFLRLEDESNSPEVVDYLL
ncbi:hypothetical protein Tco_0873973 [Tanacetum coccineum]|uniref:Reverse transcriptase domain-containing protein n=1 Tax=Tanacetum coccineum TaxID=301880 RepID=A0ABQ5BN95_9ASTR